MYKLIAAIVAVAAAGLAGALTVPASSAQDAQPEPRTGLLKPVAEGQWQDWPVPDFEYPPRSGFYEILGPGEPGTWQIITHGERVLLLNSASGHTFYLVEEDEALRWKAIPRPRATPTIWARSPVVPLPSPQPKPEDTAPPTEENDD